MMTREKMRKVQRVTPNPTLRVRACYCGALKPEDRKPNPLRKVAANVYQCQRCGREV